LASLTICCVASTDPEPSLFALSHCLDVLPGTPIKFFVSEQPKALPDQIQTVKIPRFSSVAGYSDFILADLVRYVDTSHVLIVQWDGFPLDRRAWRDEFLDFDYIGAPWPQFSDEFAVGNGGFSLRSKALLEATASDKVTRHPPEDLCICRTNRHMLETAFGLRFAPRELAMRFSFERLSPDAPTYGFHGLFNFPDVLPDCYDDLLRSFPVENFANRDARDLVLRLCSSGSRRDLNLARWVLRRHMRNRPIAVREWWPAVRACL